MNDLKSLAIFCRDHYIIKSGMLVYLSSISLILRIEFSFIWNGCTMEVFMPYSGQPKNPRSQEQNRFVHLSSLNLHLHRHADSELAKHSSRYFSGVQWLIASHLLSKSTKRRNGVRPRVRLALGRPSLLFLFSLVFSFHHETT